MAFLTGLFREIRSIWVSLCRASPLNNRLHRRGRCEQRHETRLLSWCWTQVQDLIPTSHSFLRGERPKGPRRIPCCEDYVWPCCGSFWDMQKGHQRDHAGGVGRSATPPPVLTPARVDSPYGLALRSSPLIRRTMRSHGASSKSSARYCGTILHDTPNGQRMMRQNAPFPLCRGRPMPFVPEVANGLFPIRPIKRLLFSTVFASPTHGR